MAFTAQGAAISSWVCSAIAFIILLTRAIVTRKVAHVTRLSKWLCILSILVVIARLPATHYHLKISDQINALKTIDEDDPEIPRLHKAAVSLTLCTRCLATTFFWLQVTLLQRFYSRIVDHISWTRKALTVTWVMICMTYVACILSTFLECRPFHLYWRLDPKPKCTQAYAQIFMQGGFNILLDLMLLAISFPVISHRRLTHNQVAQVALLLLFGIFCIIVTGVKLAFIVGSNSNQSARTFWGSIQIMVSAIVANSPTIYGCIMLRRRKQSTLKGASQSHSHSHSQKTRHKSSAIEEEIEIVLSNVETDTPKSVHVREESIEEGLEEVQRDRRSWLDS